MSSSWDNYTNTDITIRSFSFQILQSIKYIANGYVKQEGNFIVRSLLYFLLRLDYSTLEAVAATSNNLEDFSQSRLRCIYTQESLAPQPVISVNS